MTIRRYQIGFVLSMLLTCLSFSAVWLHYQTHHQFPTHTQLAVAIFAFAIVQLVVQLVYFLHFGRESRGRDLATFALAALLIGCIVIGSLWIMANLSNNHGVPYDGAPSPQTSTD